MRRWLFPDTAPFTFFINIVHAKKQLPVNLQNQENDWKSQFVTEQQYKRVS